MSSFQKGMEIILKLNKHFGIKEEIYFPIKDYPYYSVSTFGNIKNTKTGRILKPYINDKGYYIVCLFKNGKGATKTIHKLVANQFLINTDNKR